MSVDHKVSGKLGVGASPLHRLYVSDADLATLIAMIESTNGTTQSVQLRLKAAGVSSSDWAVINSANRLQINEVANAAATPAGEIISVRGTTGRVGIGNNVPGERFTVKDAGADTVPIASFEQTGTNGSKVRVFVGTQDPSGTISANPGDLYLRDNGTSSSTYVNNGSGDANTTWKDLGAAGAAPEETASEGWPVQAVTDTEILNSFRTDANFYGAIFYTPHDITCTHMVVRTGIGASGNVRHVVLQASDATILDGNMDKIFQVDVPWSGSGVKSTSLGGTYVIKAGYYAVLYGHTAGTDWYQDLYNTDSFNMWNTAMSANTAPTEFTTSIAASTSPTTYNPHTQGTGSNTVRCTPLHRFKTE